MKPRGDFVGIDAVLLVVDSRPLRNSLEVFLVLSLHLLLHSPEWTSLLKAPKTVIDFSGDIEFLCFRPFLGTRH